MVRPNGRRVIIATIVADAAGAISKTFTYLTKDAPTGDYQFRIEGAASGFQRGTVKVTTTPALTVKASATSVLVKKKAVLMVAGTNTSTVPLKVTVKTVFGNQTISKVKVGKPFAAVINTKLAAIPAGTAKLTLTPLTNNGSVARTVSLKYKAVKAGTSTKKKAIKASDFAKSAKQLPKSLTKAVKRDLGLTGEQYLARAEAAHRAEQVVTALGTGASTRTWLGTDGQLRVLVKNQVGAAVATEQGAVPVTSDPLGDQAAAANAKSDGRSYYVDRAAGKVRSYDSSSFRLRDVRNNELEGGDGFLFGMNGGTYRCSLAFAGVGAFGQPVQLTAGHCVEGTDRTVGAHLLDLDAPVAYGEPLSQANVVGKFGWTGPGEIGNDNDGGLLNVQGDYSAAPVVSTWGGGKGSQDDGDDVTVYDSVGAVNGMPVCKSGSTTGWTCGSVVDAETTEVIGDGAGGIAGSVNAFIFDACILSGDSGGAILSGHYALGVDSFGNMRSCADAGQEGYLSGGFSVRSGSSSVATQFGEDFNLKIHVGTPTVTKPTSTSVRALHGTVEAAAGAVVSLTVDGVAYTSTVDIAGAWQVTLPKPLKAGKHTVTVSAEHTANGALISTRSASRTTTITVPSNS